MITLYEFQGKCVDEIEAEFAQGTRSILAVSPTGSGKTVILSEVIKRRADKTQPSLVIAHRREIIEQTARKLRDNGADSVGIIMSGVEPRPQALVQVASIDTLRARAMNSTSMRMPLASLVGIDEAHHSTAMTYQRLIELYPEAQILGATATPCRGDGRGLGNIFAKMIECPQVAELIKLGLLVKSRVYAPIDPDLEGVRTQAGDYIVSQLAGRMNTDQLVGDAVTHWLKYGERRPTVAFAVDVAHSVHLRDEFLRASVRAEHLDGNTPIQERAEILARLASGETEVVTNCMVLTEGWDMPPVSCEILARPTKHMGLFRQMIGRVLRSSPGKADAIILDHSGAVFRHGLPEEHVEWTLEVDGRALNPAQVKRKSGEEHKLRECPQCQVLMLVPPCGNCGWMPVQRGRYHEVADGELGLVVNGSRASGTQYSPAEKRQWHGMFAAIQQERGRSPGWVAHTFKAKFGAWPPWGSSPAPIPPTPEARSWVRSRDIAWAKTREKRNAAA